MEVVKLLVVDDEPGMRLGAARVLKKVTAKMQPLDLTLSFQCDIAETGWEALDKLSDGQFDMVLLDYKLPDISGLEVLDQIKNREIDVVTIMMTAYASLDVAVSATKNGTFDFLAKPFTPEELESIVVKAASSLLATKQARKLSAEKRRVRFEFISVLSHELKSPLAAVESYLDLMKGHAADDPISRYDTAINRALIRLQGMRRLIFDLLDLTRIESGEKARSVGTVDVITSLNACLDNVKDAAASRGIDIDVQAPASLMFDGDKNELEIIFSNLLTNAVKYNRDGGFVKVSVVLTEGKLTIRVQDNGIGIDPADQSRLFKSFSRIRNRETESIEGSGLGLSILKRLVDLYDGAISVNSFPGKGSTFQVELNNSSNKNSN